MGEAREQLTFFRSHLPSFIEAVAWGICLQEQGRFSGLPYSPGRRYEESSAQPLSIPAIFLGPSLNVGVGAQVQGHCVQGKHGTARTLVRHNLGTTGHLSPG